MTTVRECACVHPFTCFPETPLLEAARIMWDKDCGFLPVLRSAAVPDIVGVLTDRDICKSLYTVCGCIRRSDVSSVTVSDAMTRTVHVVRAQDDVSTAHALMRRWQVRRLPVVEDGHRFVGVVTLSDLARRARQARDRSGLVEVGATLAEAASHRLPVVSAPA